MNILINILECASELAHLKLEENWPVNKPMYNGENYTEEAQDIFDEHYDFYYDMLEEMSI